MTITHRQAIIDIGSNSVRLVVFDSLARTTFTVHNEKTICSIGRELGSTGLLYRDGVDLALEALRRYRHLADRLGVAIREAVATAAAARACVSLMLPPPMMPTWMVRTKTP